MHFRTLTLDRDHRTAPRSSTGIGRPLPEGIRETVTEAEHSDEDRRMDSLIIPPSQPAQEETDMSKTDATREPMTASQRCTTCGRPASEPYRRRALLGPLDRCPIVEGCVDAIHGPHVTGEDLAWHVRPAAERARSQARLASHNTPRQTGPGRG